MAFPHTSFAKKDAIIRKEKMGDPWAAPTDRYACQTLVSSCPMNESREPLGTNEKESGGEGVPLPKSPSRDNVTTSSPVYNDRV